MGYSNPTSPSNNIIDIINKNNCSINFNNEFEMSNKIKIQLQTLTRYNSLLPDGISVILLIPIVDIHD
jgi:hypothetical protein